MAVVSLFAIFALAHNGQRYRVALIAFPLYLDVDELHGPAAAVAADPHGAHRPAAWAQPLGKKLLSELFDWRLALMPHIRIMRYRVVAVDCSFPFWLLSAISGIPALLIWRGRAKEHRDGLCQSCGYDLRATPERCPEFPPFVGKPSFWLLGQGTKVCAFCEKRIPITYRCFTVGRERS